MPHVPKVCFCCLKRFENLAMLSRHIKESHSGRLDETSMKFQRRPGLVWHCRFCLMPLCSQNARNDHETRHTGSASIPCRISGCKNLFRTCALRKVSWKNFFNFRKIEILLQFFQLHELGKHKARLYPCNRCKKLFTSRSQTEIHKKEEHSDQEEIFCCRICPVKCQSLASLERHERLRHFQICKIYHCMASGCKYFSFSSQLRDDHVHFLFFLFEI